MKGSIIHILLLACISLFALFSSCEDKDEEYLSLSHYSVNATSEGTTQNISVRTNQTWYISNSNSWIFIDPYTGSGNGVFQLEVLVNDTDEDRVAEVYVNGGKLTDTITVVQTGTYLTFDKTPNLMFDKEGTSLELEIVTNYSWEIVSDALPDWCEVTPLYGEGNTMLTLTPAPYTERIPRKNERIEIICNKTSYYITVSQEIENESPTAPVLIIPEDDGFLEGVYPYFEWEESIDPDGDQVYYQVLVSTDQKNWTDISGILTDNFFMVTRKTLVDNQLYYWKVVATDDFWGLTESEDIFRFKTGVNEIYEDGTVFCVQEMTDKTKAVNLVILGDGFVREDYGRGNIFDVMAEVAIESFFSLSPLPLYEKDYFNIYKLVAYSEESGATVTNDFHNSDIKAQTKNTAFNSTFLGGSQTDIGCSTSAVKVYVQDKLNLSEEQIDNTVIVLMINLDVYSGTTAVSKTGWAISMCPIGRDTFREVVYHEATGHGLGRLLDEYIHFETQDLPDIGRDLILSYRGDKEDAEWNFGANLSLTNDIAEVHWKRYFEPEYIDQYDVWLYEGGYRYGKGIWRPELYSCMEDIFIPYFNAPSREAIVRRIKKVAGEEFDWEEFYANDYPKSYTPTRAFRSYSTNKKKVPLAPPVLIPAY